MRDLVQMKGVRVFTTGEVASYCGVNFRTVIRWIERGLLEAYKLPGRGDHRVSLPSLLAFMVEHKMPVPPELVFTKSIMVLDDDPHVTRSITRALRVTDYNLIETNDSFSAGAQLMMARPQMLLLDWMMPHVNGEQILRFIRNQQEFQLLKVIIISGCERETLENTLKLGANAYLMKPFSN